MSDMREMGGSNLVRMQRLPITLHPFPRCLSLPSHRVVYSTEVPADVKLLPLPEEEFAKGAVKDLSAFDDFRVRILPVLGPLPAIFGLNMATYVLQAIAGKPILGPMENKNRKRIYQKLNGDLIEREGKMLGTTEGL
jgi:hypothetical protein